MLPCQYIPLYSSNNSVHTTFLSNNHVVAFASYKHFVLWACSLEGTEGGYDDRQIVVTAIRIILVPSFRCLAILCA